MAKQLYGYDPNSYSDTTNLYSRSAADTSLRGGSYRYLSTNSLPLSTSYNPESYSSRIAGISGSHGPPGVDTGASIESTNSLYPDLKRTSETLYHQSQLDAYNTTVQPEAWYSTTPLTKRPRYDITSQLAVYPQRPGQQDCAYYMQTRTCMYGEACRFHHPFWVPEGGIPDWKEGIVPGESLPERLGEPDCPYFVKTQKCKFGIKCKFNHPKVNIAAQDAPESGNGSILPERPSEPPCTFYMKTGQCKFGPTCKFHHPKDVQIQAAGGENGTGLLSIFGDSKPVQQHFAPALLHNSKGLPLRRGEDDCPFYLKTGSCKYGATCRYNHPEITAAPAPTLVTPSSTHFNLGFFNPAPSILPSYVPRLPQTTLEMAPTVYPQRAGEPECDFYMKTGICKFGLTCKFHHPVDRSLPTGATEPQQAVKLTPAGLARREGAVHCPYYMKTGTCKYGATCKFDHPPPAEILAMATSQVVPSAAVSEVVEKLSAAVGEGLENKTVTSAAVGKGVENKKDA